MSMRIPSIRESGGIFEIFVPGVFLLLNVIGTVYFSFKKEVDKWLTDDSSFSKLGLSIMIIICFGYLFGMILRLFRAKTPDQLSSWYHTRNFNLFSSGSFQKDKEWKEKLKDELSSDERITKEDLTVISKVLGNKKFRSIKAILKSIKKNADISSQESKEVKSKNKRRIQYLIKRHFYGEWAVEGFPYIGWLGKIAQGSLPKEVHDFYLKVWEPRNKPKGGNQTFFNFCKVVLMNNQTPSMADIHSAETTTRYLSGMLYSLLISFILIALSIIKGHDHIELIAVLLLVYLSSIWGIIRNYRFIRIKEAKLVFYSTYQNRALFVEKEEGAQEK